MMLSNREKKPRALVRSCSWLETKLERIRVQMMTPEDKDHILKKLK